MKQSGRPSLIKPAIIEVLSTSDKPLRFNELKSKVQLELNRQNIDDKQFGVNLKALMQAGSVDKKMTEGKLTYVLSSSYYEQKLKVTLIDLLNSRKLSQLYDRLEGEDIAPLIVFLDPPAFDYETKKPLPEADPNSYGGGPMTKPGDVRSVPDWSNPSKAIASIMINDFRGFLSPNERNDLIKLSRWAYWVGCREYIENSLILSLEENIKRNKEFATDCIKKFSGDARRVETEKRLLRILDITEGLIKKDNLDDFLKYLIANRQEHTLLLNAILCDDGPVNGGERIFTRFFDFGSRIADGLIEAGLLRDNLPLDEMPLKERFFLSTEKVWDEFFNDILFGFDFFNRESDEISDFRSVRGTTTEALPQVKRFGTSLNFLLDLPFKRRIAITYLWGFPESVLLSKQSSIRDFDDWHKALNNGHLDHREWLFSEKTLSRLTKAFRAVRQNREPMSVRIDKEEWSLRDLYRYHPLGKQPEFWQEIMNEIRNRASTKRRVYRGGPVPKGVYNEFKKMETQHIEKMLDQEETHAISQKKKNN